MLHLAQLYAMTNEMPLNMTVAEPDSFDVAVVDDESGISSLENYAGAKRVVGRASLSFQQAAVGA